MVAFPWMPLGSPPEVVRERIDRFGEGRLSCAMIFDREFSREEVARFNAQPSEEPPAPTDFEIIGRVLRYDCLEADEARWRLAAEIYLVKSFRAVRQRSSEDDLRRRLGMRSLQR